MRPRRTRRMSSEKKAAVHVPPGEGETVLLLGDTYTLKISGEQTGGAFTLLEAVVPLGGVTGHGGGSHAPGADRDGHICPEGHSALLRCGGEGAGVNVVPLRSGRHGEDVRRDRYAGATGCRGPACHSGGCRQSARGCREVQLYERTT